MINAVGTTTIMTSGAERLSDGRLPNFNSRKPQNIDDEKDVALVANDEHARKYERHMSQTSVERHIFSVVAA
ncbi:hypothetical protein BN2476_110161 [Paraburkholderia piptadeniae]|uniref:Uncharacterized protein n=1 Tax=Paraburkholderia piptadeniae TaxID=1701573 RepID=A0A1N7RQ46_9BURK|nr:hypothetical protein BN2476_110161 [Paraburkholderia piptadeniae]